MEWKFDDTDQKALKELKLHLCQAPVLGYLQLHEGAEFIVEFTCSNNTTSAVLSQIQEGEHKGISYASKSLLPSERQYSECEKHCLAATWAVLHFKHYLCGHHAIVKTSHHPVKFLTNKNCELSSRVGKWALVLQGQSMEVQYKKNHKMKHVEGLAAMHDCSAECQEMDSDDLHTTRHHKWDSQLCANIECIYTDGCSFSDENQDPIAGAGVYWPQAILNKYSQGYLLGKQTSQYAEPAASLIALKQAIDLNITEVVLCTDSKYVTKTFLEYLPRLEKTEMMNSKGKQVKNAQIISAIGSLVTTSQIHVYWKKVKRHSKENSREKEGIDQADGLAKEGAKTGQKWELDPTLIPEGSQCVMKVTSNQKQQSQGTNNQRTSGDKNTGSPHVACNLYPEEPSEDLFQEQNSDPDIGPLKKLIEGKIQELSSAVLKNNRELRLMYKRKDLFMVEKGLLMFVKEKEGCKLKYVVLLKSYRELYIWYIHDHPTSGHRGVDNTYNIAAQSHIGLICTRTLRAKCNVA